jgi:hypothetical protein
MSGAVGVTKALLGRTIGFFHARASEAGIAEARNLGPCCMVFWTVGDGRHSFNVAAERQGAPVSQGAGQWQITPT